MLVEVYLVDAFTKVAGKGNRAGVALDAGGLTDGQMQEIARVVNASETAFVLPPDDMTHEVRVRYFTPTKEVPICGHATIATHYLRAKLEKLTLPRTVLSKTGVGVLPVDIEYERNNDIRVTMTQSEPFLEPALHENIVKRIAGALGVYFSDFDTSLPIQVASTGHSKVMIALNSKQVIDSLMPNLDALKAISDEIGCNGFFTFTLDTGRNDIFLAGRMFAPAIGINEDPVTGNANGPAGYYLYVHNKLMQNTNVTRYTALQGEAMGKVGFVDVILRFDDAKTKPIVQVQGSAVQAGKILFQVNKSGVSIQQS